MKVIQLKTKRKQLLQTIMNKPCSCVAPAMRAKMGILDNNFQNQLAQICWCLMQKRFPLFTSPPCLY